MKLDMEKKEKITYESPSTKVLNLSIERILLQKSEITNDMNLKDYEIEDA